MSTTLDDLYERDFYAWTKHQAAALRKLGRERWKGPLDIDHLAEEVADLGKSERDAVRSQIRRVIEHLLKLRHSPAEGPRAGWKRSVIHARATIGDKMSESLKRDIRARLPRLFEEASAAARESLISHGEHRAADSLPATCPFKLADILRDGWYPEPEQRG